MPARDTAHTPGFDMVNAQALADELNRLLAIESRSLLRHMDESTPYTTAETFPILKQLKHMAHVSDGHAQRLSALLDRLELPERPMPYPQSVGFYHFVKVDALLGPVIAEQHERVAAYVRAVEHARGDDAAVVELEDLLKASRDALEALARLQQLHASAAK